MRINEGNVTQRRRNSAKLQTIIIDVKILDRNRKIPP